LHSQRPRSWGEGGAFSSGRPLSSQEYRSLVLDVRKGLIRETFNDSSAFIDKFCRQTIRYFVDRDPLELCYLMNVPAVRCKATSKQTGKQCKNWAIKGGEVCRKHGGGAPAVNAKAAIRAEVMNWGLGDTMSTLAKSSFDSSPVRSSSTAVRLRTRSGCRR
jgi:hypothetical protein